MISYLVEVSLQEVNLLGCAQQTRPEFLLQLLLAQHQLDFTVIVVHFAVFRVDLGVQVQRHMIFKTLFGIASERDVGRGDLEVCRFLGHIGGLDIHVKVVTLGLSAGGALSPCN